MKTSLTLHQNRKTGDFLAERYVGIRAVGKLVHISAEEMQSRGLELVLNLLEEEASSKPAEKSERSCFSKEEDRAFNSLHQGISILLSEDRSFRIGRLRRQGSGYVVLKEDVLQLTPPYTNEEFHTTLHRAVTEF